jgi:hypothetical protein
VSPSEAISERNLPARSILPKGLRVGAPVCPVGARSCGICAYFQVREIERLGANITQFRNGLPAGDSKHAEPLDTAVSPDEEGGEDLVERFERGRPLGLVESTQPRRTRAASTRSARCGTPDTGGTDRRE